MAVLRVYQPIVDNEKCINCGQCQTYCPDAACMLTPEGVIFDLRACKGCGICANECPVNAITMELE